MCINFHEITSKGEGIIKWCKDNGITPFFELEEELTLDMLRAGIHINVKWQWLEAELMEELMICLIM